MSAALDGREEEGGRKEVDGGGDCMVRDDGPVNRGGMLVFAPCLGRLRWQMEYLLRLRTCCPNTPS